MADALASTRHFPSCVDTPLWSVGIAGLASVGLFAFALWVQRRHIQGIGAAALPGRTSFQPWVHLTPAWSLLAAFVVIGLCIVGSGFFVDADMHMTAYRKAFKLVATPTDASRDGDAGPLMLWSLAYALLAGATIVAVWLAALQAARCDDGPYRCWTIASVAGLSLVAGAIAAGVISGLPSRPGVDDFAGTAMLCGVWQRTAPGAEELPARLVVALNAIAVTVPVALVMGACFVLEPVGRQWDLATGQAQILSALAQACQRLDWLLYVGAAALVAGSLQVSTLFGLALAHLPTQAEARAMHASCTTAIPEPPASVAATLPAATASTRAELQAWRMARCADSTTLLDQADEAQPLRQHARRLTVTFGLVFSVLLGVIYLSASALLLGEAERYATLEKRDAAEVRKRLVELGVESDVIGKVGRIAATFTPLAASLLPALGGG